MLIAECEPEAARDRRRESVGCSSGETYEAVLARVAPGCDTHRIKPADGGDAAEPTLPIEGYDGILFTGSPIHLYHETPEARRVIGFMRAVFASGTPAFGSCAGLQVAAVAAGGRVRSMGARREAGFARRIFPTDVGRDHKLIAGRPPAYDAPAIHTDEVEALPEGATLIASNGTTAVQAAEIRHGGGVFWGVQYHPEIGLFEVAGALRRQTDDLVEHKLADDARAVEAQAALIEALHHAPERRDLAWQLGLDAQVTQPPLRSAEIRNFIAHLVAPTRSRRVRG